MIWVVFALMTGAAILSLLWPLAGRPTGLARREVETSLYKAQLQDLQRDVERGLMSEADAEAAKAEAARRLLAATAGEPEVQPSRKNIRIAAIFALLVLPALALALYDHLGAPDYPDLPLQARLDGKSGDVDIPAAIARIERHLADQPDDVRGWEILGGVYRELGRAQDVARVYRQLLRLQGPSAQRLFGLAQALLYANDGSVNDEALAAFEQASQLDPSLIEARYYIGLAAEQRGDRQKAIDIFSKLVANAPADAPWTGVLNERIARIKGEAAPTPQDVAALPAAQQDAAIRGMVQRLNERLSAQGGAIDEWLRLVRAYAVLKQPEQAREALARARKAHPGEAASLDALAKELGLGG
jgi:cytochrome c-type biogenesis protein CcmH